MLNICFIMIYKALLVRKREASPLPANAAIKELIDGNATRGGIVGAGAGSAAADIKDKLSTQGTGGDRK